MHNNEMTAPLRKKSTGSQYDATQLLKKFIPYWKHALLRTHSDRIVLGKRTDTSEHRPQLCRFSVMWPCVSYLPNILSYGGLIFEM